MRAGPRGFGVRFPARVRDFLFSTASTRALGPIQLSVYLVFGPFLRGKTTGAESETTHFHQVPRLIMRGAVPPLSIRVPSVMLN
jgi:hypothetical protein